MGKLFSKIYWALRQEIFSCQFLPGKSWTEQGLADRFAVSRTPIRVAVIRVADAIHQFSRLSKQTQTVDSTNNISQYKSILNSLFFRHLATFYALISWVFVIKNGDLEELGILNWPVH